MKHYFKNILKLKVLLLSALLFTISSCDNDDDAFNPLLASVDVPEGFFSSNTKLYILASDKAGNVIEFAEVIEGEITELKSDSYKESTFTLSIVDIYNYGTSYKDLYGSSYHNLKRGVKVVLTEDDLEEESYLNYTAQNFDVNASEYIISSNGDNNYVYSDYLTGYLYFSKSPTRIFITKKDLNYTPTGFMFPTTTYTNGTTPTINLSGNYTAFQSETINFTEPVYAGVEVYGRSAANSYDEQYLVSDVYEYDQSIVVKYPGTTFPAYASESYVSGDDYSYEAYNKSQRSDFSMMDIDATVTITGQTITYSATGDGNVVYLDIDQDGNDFEYFDWDVYAPVGSNQSVTIPKLPVEITTGFSSYSYAAWEAQEEISVMEIETIDSIDEYFAADMGSVDYRSLNSKSMYLYLGSGVAREARMNLVKEKKHKAAFGNFKARFEKDRSAK